MPYRMYLPAEGARTLTIKAVKTVASLCEVKVLPVGEAPTNCGAAGPVDLMLILSSVSEEVDLLGGLLPLYAGEHGIKTAVVYVGRDDGNQVQEAFRALETMGLDVVPVFMQREDHKAYNRGRISSMWKESQLKEEIIALLRTYQPKVVVTADPEDSFSPVRTAYTALLVRSAINKAALDPKAKLTVQKLYHLSENGKTQVDGAVPLEVYGGRTAADVAREAYASYVSEISYGTVIPETLRFTLAFSRVGEDQQGNDLFEHIDTSGLIAYQQPTPLPTETPSPTPAPTEGPTEEPTPFAPADTPTQAPAAAPKETATAEPKTSPEPMTKALLSQLLALGQATLALYAVSGVFVFVAPCMV